MKKVLSQFAPAFILCTILFSKVSVAKSSITSSTLFGNGVNLQPSYYNNGNVNFGWSFMQNYDKIKTVRIEIEPDKVSQAQSWISQAAANGYNIIATYHKCTVLGSNDPSELLAAANWWKNNYATLAASGSFTINLMNEWGNHNISVNNYAAAYNIAIAIVRQVYSGPIIIDIPGWGQETTIAAQAILGSGITILDKNIILSAHLYPQAWNQVKNRHVNTSDLDELNATRRPCILGEFGGNPSDGPVNVTSIVTHAKDLGWAVLGWAVLGWAWNGDGGSMNMISPSWSSQPQPSSFSESSYFSRIYDLL